jgi:plasmid maintenance system antidote protein VapI
MAKRGTPPILSDTLRRIIAESGVPLLTLEQETGVKRASIRRFLAGERSLVLDNADKLAAYFGLNLTKRKGD